MTAYAALETSNIIMGRPEKAMELADRAIRLSPRDPNLFSFYSHKAIAYEMLNQPAQAIDWWRRVVAMAPGYPFAQLGLAKDLAWNGQEAEAREMLQRYLSLKTTRIRTIAQSVSDQMIESLRKAGMPEE
jgi:adenylate cyclase